MPQQYPDTFPCPQLDGFSSIVSMGVIRSERPIQQQQRRVYQTMPTVVTLSYVMTITQLGDWQDWMRQYGFDWFLTPLPGLYAGQAGEVLSPVLVRLISGISIRALNSTHVEASISVEYAPSMIKTYLEAV